MVDNFQNYYTVTRYNQSKNFLYSKDNSTHSFQFIRIVILTNVAKTWEVLKVARQVGSTEGIWTEIAPVETGAALPTLVTMMPRTHPLSCKFFDGL